jgi:hypothetical protein
MFIAATVVPNREAPLGAKHFLRTNILLLTELMQTSQFGSINILLLKSEETVSAFHEDGTFLSAMPGFVGATTSVSRRLPQSTGCAREIWQSRESLPVVCWPPPVNTRPASMSRSRTNCGRRLPWLKGIQ